MDELAPVDDDALDGKAADVNSGRLIAGMRVAALGET